MGDSESTATSEERSTACPAQSASDDQMRAAATIAFRLMRLSAAQVTSTSSSTSCASPCVVKDNVQSTSILAAQRYRVQSSGTGIEFDPTDPLYSFVSKEMQADLAFAQLDSSVAKFLSDGLKATYATDDGHLYPHLLALPALAHFSFTGPVTSHIRDSSSQDDSHSATVSSKSWCGAFVVTIAETVDESWQFAPLEFDDINMWRSSVPSYFHGTAHGANTPFNGPTGANAYLIVSIDGQTKAFRNFPYTNCWNNSGFKCTSTIEIDPVPYAEPGDYYSSAGLVGAQSNPFALSNTVLYADPAHAAQWATRVANGVQEWGVFQTPTVLFGTTKYKYVKKM